MEDVIRQLPQDEFDQRAADLAAAIMEIDSLVLEKKAIASEFKGRIEEAQGRQNRLTGIVSKRSEIRDVGCEQRINPEAKIVEIIRMDTGEIVDTRSLTAKDIQDELDFTVRDSGEDAGKKRK